MTVKFPKTCKAWKEGTCKYGEENCFFCHQIFVCFFFFYTGECKFGDQCQNSHEFQKRISYDDLKQKILQNEKVIEEQREIILNKDSVIQQLEARLVKISAKNQDLSTATESSGDLKRTNHETPTTYPVQSSIGNQTDISCRASTAIKTDQATQRSPTKVVRCSKTDQNNNKNTNNSPGKNPNEVKVGDFVTFDFRIYDEKGEPVHVVGKKKKDGMTVWLSTRKLFPVKKAEDLKIC